MSNLVPEDWKVLTIESVLDNIIDYRGKSPPKSEAGIPLITAKNVRKGFIDEEPREFIYENQFDTWMVRGTPRYGDVFITTEAPLGNVAKVPKYKFAIGQRLLALSPSADILSSDFLLQILQGEKFTEQLDLQSTGSTVAGIKQSTFRKMPLPIPPLLEQQKIAAILSSVDEVIEKTQAQINKLKDLKTGMMQELLSPREGQAANISNPQGESKNSLHHTEFKDSPLGRIPVGWKIDHLINLSANGISNGAFNDPKKVGRGYKIINVVEMYRGFGVDVNTLKLLDLDLKEFTANKVEFGDVFFTRSSLKLEGIAYCNINLSHDQSITYDGHLMRIRPDISRVLPKFLTYYCLSDFARKYFMSAAKHSTMTTIAQSDIAPLLVPIPTLEEQQLIVDYIDSIELNIRSRKKKLEQVNSLKKALKQDLLTGKIRVKVDAA